MEKRIGLKQGFRTPFVKMGKEFAELNVVDLSTQLVDKMLEKLDFPVEYIQQVIWGHVVPDPNIYSVAREVVLQSHLGNTVDAYSLSRACATTLQTTANAAAYYHCFPEEKSVILSGGVESFSNVKPILTKEAADYFQTLAGKGAWTDKMLQSLNVPFSKLLPVKPAAREYSTGLTMGEHCEISIKEFQIARKRQDAFALASHQNATKAKASIKPQIIPINSVAEDTLIREDTSMEALQSLKAVFDPEGTITAGNASPYTDGAAGLYVISPSLEDTVIPDAYLVDFAFVSVDPKDGLLMGPAKAMLHLMKRNALQFKNIDYIDMHEAFAGEVLANVDAINDALYRKEKYGVDYDPGFLDETRLNPWGSSIAYGHPFGATGARMLNQAIAFLKHHEKDLALLAACTAGATAGACLLKKHS